ncbi:universal stress protein [Glycomyces terrestris]|uniref:universal stress protein n=1 Tax=Glycomyces terrestris TaxID=2493553 RepID=UPI0018D4F506|nr:universal stress protein [Glycomyces terrestris]
MVGVDGSPSSISALGWALDEAERTGAVVRAVTAWEVPTNWGKPVPVYPGDHLEAEAGERLARIVGEATAGRPTLQVTQAVVKGHPARVLLDQARRADLLVVGQRGLGGFSGTLVGSVSQKCLHHATCPVLVVPAEGTDDRIMAGT